MLELIFDKEHLFWSFMQLYLKWIKKIQLTSVIKTLSNVYDGAFLRKELIFLALNYFLK